MPVCSKIPLLYLLTQKVAQKFGYVLGIKKEIRMKLEFINFSTEEQLKMHQVMQAIQEHQAIDELGLGRIRDAFSNKLFPGISTLHNRAKYYAILPSLFLEAEKAGF